MSGILSDYIEPAKLADELGVTLRTLQRWEQLRLGPPITELGKRRVYSRESVLNWLRSQERRRDTSRRRAAHSRATVAA